MSTDLSEPHLRPPNPTKPLDGPNQCPSLIHQRGSL